MKRFGIHSQHFIMAELYRGIIIEGIKAYDEENHTDQFYSDLAWIGLFDSEDYRALGASEINRIESVQNSFLETGNKNCE